MKSSDSGTVAAPKAWTSAGRPWATLAACGGAHVIHDGLSSLVYVLLPVWAKSFSLTLTQAATLKATYSLSLAVFQVPVSFLSEWLGEWLGERGMLVFGTVLAGAGFLLLGWAGGFGVLMVLLVLAGMGSAVQHPLASSLVSAAFESGHRRGALGTYNFTGDLGKMALPGMAALSLGAYPWAYTTTGVGVLCLVAALGLLLALRAIAGAPGAIAGAPSAIAGAPGAVADKAGPTRTGVGKGRGGGWGIRDPFGFAVLSAIGVVDSATRGGILVLLPFLLIEKGAAVESVGLGLTLVFAGGACGKFVCGLIAERFGIVRTVIATELFTAAGIGLLIVLPLQWTYVVLPLFGIALNGTSSVLYGTVADLVTPQRRARVFALFYTLVTGSSGVAAIIFGAVGDYAGIPTACAIMAGTVLLALPLCPWLRE